MQSTDPKVRALVDKATRELTDKGLLIEAGWAALRIIAVPEDAGEVQIREMRNAFFAGAQHVLGSIMGMMDDDREPTAADLRRIELIDRELRRFIEDFEREHGIRRPPVRTDG